MAQVNLGHVVGPGVPTGGTANQVLVKNGTTNFDTSWKDASQLPAIGDEAAARDAADAALADGLAIIANGDTHAAVAADQAVFVRSHSTLAAGLYWASSAIGTNAALSTSNLKADSQGGLNKLKADIDSLNSNFTPSVVAVQPFGQWTNYTGGYYIIGNMVIVQVTAVAGNFGANDYFTMVNSLPTPAGASSLSITTTSDNYKGAEAYVGVDGKLVVKSGANALTGQRVVVTGIYIKS